jgi:SAM-dependent methyltransferase
MFLHFKRVTAIVDVAEKTAAGGGDFLTVVRILRHLSLDEFGELFVSMPSPRYPALSSVLPAMPPAKLQRNWTGLDGMNLYSMTSQFIRAIEVGSCRLTGASIVDKTVLDFGCGFGRLIRMMYFYTDPDKIWGVDPWQASLDQCRALPGNFRKSDEVPSRLPADGVLFDFGYAFSVFTHLRDYAVLACLAAIRKSFKEGGLFVGTIRPIEFWDFVRKRRDAHDEIAAAEQSHAASGYGFLTHGSGKLEHYGVSSFDTQFFRSVPGWRFAGHDSLMSDPYQTLVFLIAE